MTKKARMACGVKWGHVQAGELKWGQVGPSAAVLKREGVGGDVAVGGARLGYVDDRLRV